MNKSTGIAIGIAVIVIIVIIAYQVNESQLNQLWAIREGITENLSKEPTNLYKFDIICVFNYFLRKRNP